MGWPDGGGDVPTIAGLAPIVHEDALYIYADEARPCAESEYRQGDTSRPATTMCAIAAELSEDQRSKNNGGDLGWFSRERLATDFTAAVFALPDKTPSLLRTKLGWHLVELLERKPARVETVAMANKSARIVWAVLTRDEPYSPRAAV